MAVKQIKKKKNKAAKRRKNVYSNRMDFFLTRKGAAQVMALVIILTIFIGPMRTVGSSFNSLCDAFYTSGGIGQEVSVQLAAAKDIITLSEEKLGADNIQFKELKRVAEEAEAKMNANSSDFNAVNSAGQNLDKAAEMVYTELNRADLSSEEIAALQKLIAGSRYLVTQEQIDTFNRMAEEYNAKRTASILGRFSGTPVIEYIELKMQ